MNKFTCLFCGNENMQIYNGFVFFCVWCRECKAMGPNADTAEKAKEFYIKGVQALSKAKGANSETN